MRIFLSGVHGGSNPSPGVGIARSLRIAFPDSHLTAVDYSPRSTGLLWEDFNNCVIRESWQTVNMDHQLEFVKQTLDSGALWISGLDLELRWLSERISHSNLPIPPLSALNSVSKPAEMVASFFDFSVPPYLHLSASDDELHSFCRTHGWPIWLKGPYYEAAALWSWAQLAVARNYMTSVWHTESQLFLQAHVHGQEKSIAFAAHNGRLLGSVGMEKLEKTSEGKTWSGRTSILDPNVHRCLDTLVGELVWSGGGEVECIEDPIGKIWIIECNPRFPAWIHGATLAGTNLPGLLVEAITGNAHLRIRKTSHEFTRVVLEIPKLVEL